MATDSKDTGIETLREMVQAFNACDESFLEPFSVAQLLKIRAAWLASDWDYCPDRWTARQVREALRGVPPQWDLGLATPVYAPRKRTK